MSVVIWILAGALLGAAASALMHARNLAGIAQNVVTGIASVLSGGWTLGALTGMSAFNPEAFFIASLLVSLLGATVMLMVLQLLRGSPIGDMTPHLPAPFRRHSNSPGLKTVSKM